MAVRTTLRVLLTVAVLTAASTAQTTQKSAGTRPATDTSKKPACATNCPPTEDSKPSAVEQFPFPGESTKPVDPPASGAPPDAPNAPTPAADPGKQFPFPGDADSSSSSSTPDAATSPDPAAAPSPDDVTPDEPKSTRRKLPKVKNLQSPEDREAEDIKVARFYCDTGNWTGAYLRSKDAIKIQPEDPEAHLLLAEIARKLDKRDEAIAEFNALLKLDAAPEQIKTARKALAQLQ